MITVSSIWVLFGMTLLQAEIKRIMPLGDSITYDNNLKDEDDPRPEGERSGYRSYLWYKLQNAGYEADFVGSEHAGYDVTPPFDPDNEGHPGWNSYKLEDFTYEFLSNNPADIVLLHIGTNDHRTSMEGVGQVLDRIDTFEQDSGQHVKVYIALIIDRKEHDPIIEEFNDNMKEFVGTRIRNGDDLTLVNMYTGTGLTSRDYSDNTHPNSSGYQKMAEVWFNALLGPETPGLYAFPYTILHSAYIDKSSIVVDDAAQVVSFTADIPQEGIKF